MNPLLDIYKNMSANRSLRRKNTTKSPVDCESSSITKRLVVCTNRYTSNRFVSCINSYTTKRLDSGFNSCTTKRFVVCISSHITVLPDQSQKAWFTVSTTISLKGFLPVSKAIPLKGLLSVLTVILLPYTRLPQSLEAPHFIRWRFHLAVSLDSTVNLLICPRCILIQSSNRFLIRVVNWRMEGRDHTIKKENNSRNANKKQDTNL